MIWIMKSPLDHIKKSTFCGVIISALMYDKISTFPYHNNSIFHIIKSALLVLQNQHFFVLYNETFSYFKSGSWLL